MAEPLIVTLKTLTPLWTGGVETGRMDRVHETGILGSLRWWYEVIVRGLGGNACDPTSHACLYDPDKTNQGICDVCRLFGATGWRRRFRLEIEDETGPTWVPPDRMLNIRPPDRTRGWYLPPGRMGTLTLRIHGDGEACSRLAALFLFLEQWGNIGARPQLGYGVFGLLNRGDLSAQVAEYSRSRRWPIAGDTPAEDRHPDLRRFGFFRYRFQPDSSNWWTSVPGLERVAAEVHPLVRTHNTAPVAPALKNEWRFRRWQGSRQEAQEIFGALRPERQRSKIGVSWAYPVKQAWEVRGWAWLANPGWAERVWGLLNERDGWERTLGVQGELTARRIETDEQVLELLEKTL